MNSLGRVRLELQELEEMSCRSREKIDEKRLVPSSNTQSSGDSGEFGDGETTGNGSECGFQSDTNAVFGLFVFP